MRKGYPVIDPGTGNRRMLPGMPYAPTWTAAADLLAGLGVEFRREDLALRPWRGVKAWTIEPQRDILPHQP